MNVLDSLNIHDLTIVGQSSDKKIVFCYHKCKRRIICIDQHAADEKYNFETLQATTRIDSQKLVRYDFLSHLTTSF